MFFFIKTDNSNLYQSCFYSVVEKPWKFERCRSTIIYNIEKRDSVLERKKGRERDLDKERERDIWIEKDCKGEI